MIEPKEFEVNGKTFILSKFPAVQGREIVAKYPPPIYVNHEIIHNNFVVRMFERKGVIFEPALEKIPK